MKSHPVDRRAARSRLSRWVRFPALVLSVVLVAASCTAEPSSGSGSSNPTVEQFCEFWQKAEDAKAAQEAAQDEEEPGGTAEESDDAIAVAVKKGVVATAEETTFTGDRCTDIGATVELDGAAIAEGSEKIANPEEPDPAKREKVAAVTGEELTAGTPVLDNVRISSLSAEITPYGITVKGNVRITLSGRTSTIGFIGTLTNLENWSISISSSNFTIPGITTSPVVFSGTLRVVKGKATLEMSARATEIKVGDITVSRAELDVFASQTQGVSAHIAGEIKVGPSRASGVVDVVFDRAGALVSADVDLNARLVGQQANGEMVDLTGSVKLNGNAQQTVASFSGSGTIGALVIHEANGELTLEPNRATFVGVLDVEQGDNYVRFNGAIVWDGLTATIPYMNLQGEGQISGTLDDGQQVSVSGSIDSEMIGGQLRAVVTGEFKIGTLKASGSAVLETSGHTTTLELDASLVDAGFSAGLDGVIQITDGRAELVELNAAVNGQVDLGDVTLTGANMSIRSTYGSPLDISFSGGIAIGNRADLNGSLKASIGPNGKLMYLQGEINGSMALDSWALLNFSGSIVATVDQVTVTGSGGVHLNAFPLGLTLKGSLTSSLTNPSWSLSGTAKVRIAQITLASARLKLSQTEGMVATRAGFEIRIIGIPTYLEGDFYMKSSGACEKVVLTGGSFLARPIARLIMPDLVGCPVI